MPRYRREDFRDHTLFTGATLQRVFREAFEDACACEVGRRCPTCDVYVAITEALVKIEDGP